MPTRPRIDITGYHHLESRIEILWRFMKYNWIQIKDSASTQTLED